MEVITASDLRRLVGCLLQSWMALRHWGQYYLQYTENRVEQWLVQLWYLVINSVAFDKLSASGFKQATFYLIVKKTE